MGDNTKVVKEKKIAARKGRTKNTNSIFNSSYIEYIFIFLIAVFLLVIPFFRGLYFRENYIVSIIYMSSVFILYILYKLVKRDYMLIKSNLDIAMFLLPVVYLISFFFSVNARDAFDAVLKYAAYFMIYKIVSDLCRNILYRKIFEYVIVTAMFVMAAASLMTAFGYLDLNGVIIGKTIFGLYQYSNATASTMGAAIFMTLGFSINSSKLYEKVYYSLVLSISFPVFLLTLSRGAYIIFAALAILNILLLDAKKRIHFVYSLVTISIATAPFLFKYFTVENLRDSIIYCIGVIVIFVSLQLLYNILFSALIERSNTKAVNLMMVLTLSILMIMLIVVFSVKVPGEYKIEHKAGETKSWKDKSFQVYNLIPDEEYTLQFYAKANVTSERSHGVVIESINDKEESSRIFEQFGESTDNYQQVSYRYRTKADTKKIIIRIYNYEENSYTVYKDIKLIDTQGNIVKEFNIFKYLPETLANRLADINLQTQSVSARAYFFKDGIKIIRENFLIGTGGGGWRNLYRQYQSFPYDSSEAHNFYLQYAIETGILGIVVLLAIYYVFIKKAFMLILKDKRYEQLPVYFALLMMMGHAFMDFDLSLAALAFLFWMMIGIACATDIESEEKQFSNTFLRLGLLIGVVIILFFSSSIYIGILQGVEAASLIDKDMNRSISLYESAMKRDPFSSNYHLDYTQLMYRNFRSSNDAASLMKMHNSMDKLLDMYIQDTRQSSVIVNLLLTTGKWDKAINVVNDMVDKNPMIADMYMYKINVNYEIAKHYFSNKEHKNAIPYLNNMIEAKVQFDSANSRSIKPLKVPDKMDDMVGLAYNWLDIAQKR